MGSSLMRRILIARQVATDDAKPSCATAANGEDYNLNLHIAAVFIILFVSSTACAFPLIVVKAPRLRIPPTFLFIVRHFGTGVLIATAFVHLLPTAFISLTDPCLPDFWNKDYPAMAGALALAAVFLIAVVEMVFSPGKNGCAMPVGMMEESVGNENAKEGASVGNQERERRSEQGIIHGRNNSTGRELQRITKSSAAFDAGERHTLPQTKGESKQYMASSSGNGTALTLIEMQKHKNTLMQCLLLEMGILFHSVFIGMALSVAVGNDFIVLLIAITFHQTFEGLALGSRIAVLSWRRHALQPWLMALAYGCTTPIGQAVGLATRTLYAPGSQVGLLMVGIMNAISSGLLTFTSLVDLMSEDFLSDESWTVLRGRRRVWACLLVFAGAFGMSLIGAWA
ncbi:hypothetical protein VC83_01033 [Pseudogymnoascus destructans]|uniref:High-affinity Zn(2+) transporter zrt1 n=2 Tax=Pseudogymnoascus destructans TaxID=655981 RepID=L8G780_PSED2|nr:uncharacterized protein VC83_01033 [Pseudogymnoascus destructans]ELR07861.1 hypothetical protein GMDG_00482 [Pseudogymnoascus destructans 20631-21]OAF62191.1 hypothetical protein VC83_01033 [Pseudogymnoascus destructans]